MESDFYNNSAYTADISKQMRVPDRLMAHGESHMVNGVDKEDIGEGGMSNGHLYGMQVPDRILVAGSDGHIPSKSGPRELQLERSVLPPTPEHVRVQTPPRNINLEHCYYPSAQEEPYCQTPERKINGSIKLDEVVYPSAVDDPQPADFVKNRQSNNINKATELLVETPSRGGGDEGGLSVYEEVQMMRRQIAKLNHRLMAVELENQQQQQREMLLTVLVSGYFIVKVLVWVNKAM